MRPHFGFCDVMSLSGKKSDLKFEILEILVQILMGNRPFFASLDFFMRSDPALFLKLRALKLLIPPQPDTIAHPITQTSPPTPTHPAPTKLL